ncbi:MAG TPA: rRNA maturation RNase YbeY [Ferruginibacter sp.]|nr:rRNA maturation RNase YbeY [Ferruginibacter sp.]
MATVQFFFHNTAPFLRERKKLKRFIEGIFKKEKTSLSSLSYIFCSDEYLLKINKEFLKHDYYTDIITFNLSLAKDKVEGEIYVSYDRVKDNARREAVSFQEELHRVIFHGALHLCGYKDKSKSQIAAMRNKEAEYLKAYL